MTDIYAAKVLAVLDQLAAVVEARRASENFGTLEIKVGQNAEDRSHLKEGVYIHAPDDGPPNAFPSDYKRDTKLAVPILVRTRDLRPDDSGTRRLVEIVGLVMDAVGANITLNGTCDKAVPLTGEVQEQSGLNGLTVYEELVTIEVQLIYRMR